MLKVGLTGGIGSGKTTVARILSSIGIPVFYADEQARNLMESSPGLIQEIKNTFGAEVYADNKLNREVLAKIVFNNPDRLSKLNHIVHPAVHKHFLEWSLAQKDVPYLLEEAALLFETGIWKTFDYNILVVAPEEKRIERVMQRDNVSREEVIKRMNAQMRDDEKIPQADFLIFNDDLSLVSVQVLAFHKKLISLKK
ncbi:MAG: dephospho-CoA kinase [Bacteroidales bacterium]|nr:dephospho-CoA kinase [Bacteroidales bacterium]MCB9012865.1 dephospho-CoA kinase [Bacteroidales bacterium]